MTSCHKMNSLSLCVRTIYYYSYKMSSTRTKLNVCVTHSVLIRNYSEIILFCHMCFLRVNNFIKHV